MATRRCPKCNLINPGTTSVCDCGWSFVDGTMAAPRRLSRHDGDELRRARGTSQLVVGGVLLVLGIIITAVTYGNASTSPTGGTYIIAYGPIIFGVISIIRGLSNRSS